MSLGLTIRQLKHWTPRQWEVSQELPAGGGRGERTSQRGSSRSLTLRETTSSPYHAFLKGVLCFTGKLLDITGEYKYLYIASGTVVLVSGTYLLIGNAINYRLLDKERKREKAKKKKSASHASREMEALNRSKQDEVTV